MKDIPFKMANFSLTDIWSVADNCIFMKQTVCTTVQIYFSNFSNLSLFIKMSLNNSQFHGSHWLQIDFKTSIFQRLGWIISSYLLVTLRPSCTSLMCCLRSEYLLPHTGQAVLCFWWTCSREDWIMFMDEHWLWYIYIVLERGSKIVLNRLDQIMIEVL